MLWVKLFAYFSFSIVSNLQSQHFRIAKKKKKNNPNCLNVSVLAWNSFKMDSQSELNWTQVVFLAPLHFWQRALSSSLTWLGPSVFLLPLLQVISWTPPMDLPFHLFPLRPCALGANLIIKAPSFWPPATEKKKNPQKTQASSFLRRMFFPQCHLLTCLLFPWQFVRRWTWCIDIILANSEINVWYASLKMLTEHFAWQYFPITFHSVQPSAQSRRALLLKKNPSFFLPSFSCVRVLTHSRISFS